MKRVVNFLLSLMVLFSVLYIPMRVYADPLDLYTNSNSNSSSSSSSSTSSESLVEYAMKWKDNPNIPYVWGGGRGENDTLESLSSDPSTGTDCSGFVRLVYKHFDISLPTDSESMFSSAKKIMYNQAEAVPGDICYWSGHVAIYIGDNKIIHTNTHVKPGNLIHVSEFMSDANPSGYRVPTAYIRLVDDISVYGESSSATEEEVKQAESTGNIITESDITGMPTQESIAYAQQRVQLMGKEGLTQADLICLEEISNSIEVEKTTPIDIYHKVSSFIGIVLITYAMLLFVAYVFDIVNVFIDISLIGILSFGKWRVVSKEDVKDGIIKPGYNKDTKKTYLTSSLLIMRVVIVLVIGIFLLSGKLNEWITLILYKFSNLY